MSFHINSDKEKIRGVNPKLIGDNEVTIRGGTGSNEREILRTQLDTSTQLPRVGINRTGQRVNNVNVLTGGSGYTSAPTVTISAPPMVEYRQLVLLLSLMVESLVLLLTILVMDMPLLQQ